MQRLLRTNAVKYSRSLLVSNSIFVQPTTRIIRLNQTDSLENKLAKDFNQTKSQKQLIKDRSTIPDVPPSFSAKNIPRNASLFSSLTLLPSAVATGMFIMGNADPESVMVFQLNYAAILLAYQGAVHYGMAIGAYGDPLAGKPTTFLKETQATAPLTQEELDAAKDNTERTNLIDNKSPVSIQSKVGLYRTLWSMIPAIIGLSSMGLAPLPAVVNLTLGYITIAAYDTTTAYSRLAPYWFPAHRVIHSIFIVVFLLTSLGLYTVYDTKKVLHEQTEALRRQVEGIPEPEEEKKQTRRPMKLPPPRAEVMRDFTKEDLPQEIDFEKELKAMDKK